MAHGIQHAHWQRSDGRAACGPRRKIKIANVDEFMRRDDACGNCMLAAKQHKSGQPRGFPGQLGDMRRAMAMKEGA